MLYLDTPLIVGIFIKTCCIREQGTVSHPQDFVDFHFAATLIVIECFDLVHISQHNGHYKIIAF